MHIDYPISIDRLLGFGELPTLRLQRALARVDTSSGTPSWRLLDRVLVWAHWSVVHGARMARSPTSSCAIPSAFPARP